MPTYGLKGRRCREVVKSHLQIRPLSKGNIQRTRTPPLLYGADAQCLDVVFPKLKNKTKLRCSTLFSLSGNPWAPRQFLNPGSRCPLPALITSGATNWQQPHSQGLKTNSDSTYLSSGHQHLPQKLPVEAPRRPDRGVSRKLCCYMGKECPISGGSNISFLSRLSLV